VWDVGAGNGSVGVECARFGAAVIAVEADGQRCDRIAATAERYGVDVRVVAGVGPHVFTDLPDPDAVFVGGGGRAVIAACAARVSRVVVVALARVEEVGGAVTALDGAGLVVGGTVLQASRLVQLAGGHRLAATNPVFLVWGSRR